MGDVTWEVLNTASGILKDFNKQTSTGMTQPGWEAGKSSHTREVGTLLIISSWLARAGLEAGRESLFLLTISQGWQTQGPPNPACAYVSIVLWGSGGGNLHLAALSCV